MALKHSSNRQKQNLEPHKVPGTDRDITDRMVPSADVMLRGVAPNTHGTERAGTRLQGKEVPHDLNSLQTHPLQLQTSSRPHHSFHVIRLS